MTVTTQCCWAKSCFSSSSFLCVSFSHFHVDLAMIHDVAVMTMTMTICAISNSSFHTQQWIDRCRFDSSICYRQILCKSTNSRIEDNQYFRLLLRNGVVVADDKVFKVNLHKIVAAIINCNANCSAFAINSIWFCCVCDFFIRFRWHPQQHHRSFLRVCVSANWSEKDKDIMVCRLCWMKEGRGGLMSSPFASNLFSQKIAKSSPNEWQW